MMENISDEKLDELYQSYMKFTDMMASDYPAPMLAGVMMAISMQIYKSILTEDDFDSIMDDIYDSRHNVKGFKDIKRTILQ